MSCTATVHSARLHAPSELASRAIHRPNSARAGPGGGDVRPYLGARRCAPRLPGLRRPPDGARAALAEAGCDRPGLVAGGGPGDGRPGRIKPANVNMVTYMWPATPGSWPTSSRRRPALRTETPRPTESPTLSWASTGRCWPLSVRPRSPGQRGPRLAAEFRALAQRAFAHLRRGLAGYAVRGDGS